MILYYFPLFFLKKVGISKSPDELDTSDDASVTAKYEYLTDYWQQKDKELELELQQIQSEHNAIETELDSVKKVIEKNVDKSFKTFG